MEFCFYVNPHREAEHFDCQLCLVVRTHNAWSLNICYIYPRMPLIPYYWKTLLHQPLAWVVILSLVLGFWGIKYALPDLVTPDEQAMTRGALLMVSLKNPFPVFNQEAFRVLYYPPLTSYYFLIGLVPVLGLYYLTGGFASLSMFTDVLVLDPTVPWLTTRVMTVLLAAAGVYFLGKTAERIKNGSGVYSALFLATSFYYVLFMHSPRHWIMSVFTVIAIIDASWRLYQTGEEWTYWYAGFAVGFAFMTSTVPVIHFLIPLGAHFLRSSSFWMGCQDRRLFIMIGIVAALLVITTAIHPYVVLNRLLGNDNTFSQSKTLVGIVETLGRAAKTFALLEPVFFLFTIVGFVIATRRIGRFVVVMAVSSIVLIFSLYVGYYYFGHGLLWVYPVFATFAGIGVSYLTESIPGNFNKIIISLIIFSIPLTIAARVSWLMSQEDTRHLARDFVNEKLDPKTAKIFTNEDTTKIVWPTKKAIKERLTIGPTSSRIQDQVLLLLPEESYPTPSFYVFESSKIAGSNYAMVDQIINTNFLEREKFTHYIIDPGSYVPKSVVANISNKDPVASFGEKDGRQFDVFHIYWDGPVTDLFTIDRFGPAISIYQTE